MGPYNAGPLKLAAMTSQRWISPPPKRAGQFGDSPLVLVFDDQTVNSQHGLGLAWTV